MLDLILLMEVALVQDKAFLGGLLECLRHSFDDVGMLFFDFFYSFLM